MPKSDIEIAREATMQPIAEIGAKLKIPADALMQYGPTKAKISYDFIKGLKLYLNTKGVSRTPGKLKVMGISNFFLFTHPISPYNFLLTGNKNLHFKVIFAALQIIQYE